MEKTQLNFKNEGNSTHAPLPAAREDEYTDAAWGVENWGKNFEPMNIPIPKTTGRLVKIEGLYSGICHTDVHFALNDLGGMTYPMVPGHELLGKVVEVGDQVTKFKVGDLAGIAALTDSCLDCSQCKAGDEQYCEGGWQSTYGHPKKHGHYGGNQDIVTLGGYTASFCHDERFVCKIPSGIDKVRAAPLLCAGITLYDPLKYYGMVDGPKKTVGIAGIGGLGTMGIKLAKAMGHTVVAISSGPSKEKLAKEKGADMYVVSREEESMKAAEGTCDLILNTIAAPHEPSHYLGLLKANGTIVQLGVLTEEWKANNMSLLASRKSISGSLIGGIGTTEECIEFCHKHDIYPDTQLVNAKQIDWVYEQLTKSNPDGLRYVIDIKKSLEDKDFMPK